jgi:hypothetical protein
MALPEHRAGTAAQINVYPMDLRHVEHLLPHQIRVWGDMVDRVVVTVDVHQSSSGRYRGSNFVENLRRLRTLLESLRTRHPKLEVIEVDYGPETVKRVAQYFFGADRIPVKAWDGGPFYTYFYGLYTTAARYVSHFDGDMFFGGCSRTWMAEAISLLDSRPDVLLACPLPGPPREDGQIFGHHLTNGFAIDIPLDDPRRSQSYLEREPHPSLAYRFSHVSTRGFVIDMLKFKETVGTLPLVPPSPTQRLKAWLLGNPPELIPAEMILSLTLARLKLLRVDFLGASPGLWSLHPPFRSEEFYRRLPEIIERVEHDRVPEEQRGDYDLNDSFIDWTAARARNRWHRRYFRMLRDRLSGWIAPVSSSREPGVPAGPARPVD